MAESAEINHKMAESTIFANGFCWPLKRSQRLIAFQEPSSRGNFERKNPSRESGEISIDGHSGQFMP